MLGPLYKTVTFLAAPFVGGYLSHRLRLGKEDKARFGERFGHASQPRPDGPLIWCHAASVGEAASLLTLIDRLREGWPHVNLLVTSGTVTSAGLLRDRLPKEVIHQYIPVDLRKVLSRFFNHWRPSLALFVESELWPNTLMMLKERDISVILINGRMSEKSFRNWRKVPGWAKTLLSAFSITLVQTEQDAKFFSGLGAPNVKIAGNIKYAAKPLPALAGPLQDLAQSVAGRSLWLMASTHVGEEEIALSTHRALQQQFPDLLTIIAPRHASRGDSLAQRMKDQGFRIAQRSKNELPRMETEIYLADTMGELGLFYRVAPVVAMGGSFVNVGGHNPIEPAQLGAAIVVGPFMHNFTAMTAAFLNAQAMIQAADDKALGLHVALLLADDDARKRLAKSAQEFAETQSHIMDGVMRDLAPWLDKVAGGAR